MEYSIKKLSQIAGISSRTLRYYDEIGLLKPSRINSSNYRIYTDEDIDLLQHIMFYKELGISLEEIKQIISDKNYDKGKALESHLVELKEKRNQIDILIQNVIKTIETIKGERNMTNEEKFKGLKKTLIEKNEKEYGKEISAKYGDETVEASNQKFNNMSKEKYEMAQSLSEEINSTLKLAIETKDISSELAIKAVELHKEWICIYWPEGMYSPEAHIGLAQMYVEDERFKKYYDAIEIGCAEFLRDAIINYYSDKNK